MTIGEIKITNIPDDKASQDMNMTSIVVGETIDSEKKAEIDYATLNADEKSKVDAFISLCENQMD